MKRYIYTNIVLFAYCQSLSTPELKHHTTKGSAEGGWPQKRLAEQMIQQVWSWPKQDPDVLLSPSTDWTIVCCSAMWILQRINVVSMTNCLNKGPLLQMVNLLSPPKGWATVSFSLQSCLNPWRGQHKVWCQLNLPNPGLPQLLKVLTSRDRSHQQLWNWLKTSFSAVTGKYTLALIYLSLRHVLRPSKRWAIVYCFHLCNPLKEQSTVWSAAKRCQILQRVVLCLFQLLAIAAISSNCRCPPPQVQVQEALALFAPRRQCSRQCWALSPWWKRRRGLDFHPWIYGDHWFVQSALARSGWWSSWPHPNWYLLLEEEVPCYWKRNCCGPEILRLINCWLLSWWWWSAIGGFLAGGALDGFAEASAPAPSAAGAAAGWLCVIIQR